MTKIDSRSRQQYSNRTACSTVQTKFCRYTELIRLCFQHKWIASLGAVSTVLCTPLRYLERERTEGRKREKFYICLDVTHTHTHARTHARTHAHTTLSHTTLSRTIFHTQSFTRQLCPTPSFTYNFVTHTQSFTQLCHTHTQLCHTPSFTHNFVTHHLSHTTLPHTLAQKYLIELLMWSASGVHKQSLKV